LRLKRQQKIGADFNAGPAALPLSLRSVGSLGRRDRVADFPSGSTVGNGFEGHASAARWRRNLSAAGPGWMT